MSGHVSRDPTGARKRCSDSRGESVSKEEAAIITAAVSAMGHGGARPFGAAGARVVVIDPVSRNARATAGEVRRACAEAFAVTGDL